MSGTLTDGAKRRHNDKTNNPVVAREDLDSPCEEQLYNGCDNALYQVHAYSARVRSSSCERLTHDQSGIRCKYCQRVAPGYDQFNQLDGDGNVNYLPQSPVSKAPKSPA